VSPCGTDLIIPQKPPEIKPSDVSLSRFLHLASHCSSVTVRLLAQTLARLHISEQPCFALPIGDGTGEMYSPGLCANGAPLVYWYPGRARGKTPGSRPRRALRGRSSSSRDLVAFPSGRMFLEVPQTPLRASISPAPGAAAGKERL